MQSAERMGHSVQIDESEISAMPYPLVAMLSALCAMRFQSQIETIRNPKSIRVCIASIHQKIYDWLWETGSCRAAED